MSKDANFGKLVRDKVTGFEGVVIGRCDYLYGCSQYGIVPKVDKDGKTGEVHWFDAGRIEVVGAGVSVESVQADEPGAESQPHPQI